MRALSMLTLERGSSGGCSRAVRQYYQAALNFWLNAAKIDYREGEIRLF
jgi:hypothetical protein